MRRQLLELLPKVLLSRLTGRLTRLPLPRGLRPRVHGWFARRYGCDLAEVAGDLADFGSLAAFFQRPLRAGARPLGQGPLVWPCDGRIVTCGPIAAQRIPQVKGQDYELGELLGDAALAVPLAGGSQATVYLAPGDYHRVHSPFAAEFAPPRHIPGALFPVNPQAVRCVPRLFARNERMVFPARLADGRAAAVVMVAALNVGDIQVAAPLPGPLAKGQELGRFGFGSTVVVVVGPGGAGFADIAPETTVRCAADLPA